VQPRETIVNIWTFSIILYNEPTNAQLINNLLYCSLLYCCYMFRHYCIIFRELVVSTLPSYTSILRILRNVILVVRVELIYVERYIVQTCYIVQT